MINNKVDDDLEKTIASLEKECKRYELLLDSIVDWDHDFRTTLSPILGFSKLLLDTDLDPTQREYVNKINKYSKILLSEINDFRDKMICTDRSKNNLSGSNLDL